MAIKWFYDFFCQIHESLIEAATGINTKRKMNDEFQHLNWSLSLLIFFYYAVLWRLSIWES